jgi:hypothetical protein
VLPYANLVLLVNTYDSFDFDTDLANAWCVINENSGPGCQSVIAGVPAFVGADSLAAPVANLDLVGYRKAVDARSHGLVGRYCTHRVDYGRDCFRLSSTKITA